MLFTCDRMSSMLSYKCSEGSAERDRQSKGFRGCITESRGGAIGRGGAAFAGVVGVYEWVRMDKILWLTIR